MPYRPNLDDWEQMVVALWGDKKTGKTHFCLTAPEPLYLINTDHGFKELLRRPEFRGLDIQVEDVVEDAEAGALGSFEAAQPALARFHETYMAWIAELKGHGGTIIIDNASFLWDLVQYVKLEEAKQARATKWKKKEEELKDSRFDYGPVNHYYNVLMRAIYGTKGNLILTHSAKSKYDAKGEELPELQMQGFRATGAIVQTVAQTYKVGGEFRLMVTHSRHAPAQEGLWIPNHWDKLKDLLLG